MTKEQELFTILSSMILNKTYCRLDKEDLNSKYKASLFRVQGIQLLDSGGYLILLECMDDPNGRFTTSNILQIKPYLRSISNMIEKEQYQLGRLLGATSYNLLEGEYSSLKELLEYSYKNHIDLFGFIPKGLALEATKDMYNTKTE